jgi:hypothetical protein
MLLAREVHTTFSNTRPGAGGSFFRIPDATSVQGLVGEIYDVAGWTRD